MNVVIHKTFDTDLKVSYSLTIGSAMPIKLPSEDAFQIIESNKLPLKNTITLPKGNKVEKIEVYAF